MKIFSCLALLSGMLLLGYGCNQEASETGTLVTERIQYDVSIVSPDPEYDWWVQNIEGSKRETFVRELIDGPSNGRVKAYDFFSYKLLGAEDVKNILRRVDTVSLERPEPPHMLYDTVLVREISIRDISKIRFLEEWQMDKNNLAISKKVSGVCPLVEVFTEIGESRGFKPLFWVFFDEQYPGKFGLSR
jgi:hypothetical protein